MREEPIQNNNEKQEAINFINIIIQQCSMMGSNDFEIPTLIRLRESVSSGEISPDEAKNQAQQILDSKQDYH